MRIDLGSIAFNANISSGGGTPSWGTALGQSAPDYKITYEGATDIIIAMTHCFYPKNNVYLPMGKGGKIYSGAEENDIQQIALFKKTYVNGIPINYPMLLALIIDSSRHHFGRKTIKYSNKIVAKDEKGIVIFDNDLFYRKMADALNISQEASWFIYEINTINQDELHFSAVVMNPFEEENYPDSITRKNAWIAAIPHNKVTPSIKLNNDSILQQIVYGAPGTGKSYSVKKETKPYEENERVFRTTFHPDSDYSTFVGAYKPTTELVQKYYDGQPLKDIDGNPITEKVITYEFVQQVFLQAYVAAWKDRSQRVYLVIEEINRGNCAQIFGDLFQLLDRGENGYSEYPIRADKDLQNTLKAAFADVEIDDYPKIKSGVEMLLPDNFYIRATMNTSDQSLFPIDSAFKRRWDWKYTPISKVENKPFIIKVDDDNYSWWKFLCSINKEISTTTYSEDKKLGYFFCNSYDGIISANTFVNKVVFYLWNDVFKDYGFSNEFFNDPNDTEDDKLSFNKFFITNGEANTATIKQFFSNLGLKPINQDDNEIEEDDEDKKQGRDTTRYSINGNGSFTKKYLGYEMIKLYVEARANVTVEDVIKEWYDLSRVNRFVENQADYETRTEDGKTRAQSIQCADGLVWVTTNGWIPETIDELIANVNDKNWGIKVEKIA